MPTQSGQSIGGGWTFMRTFRKYAEKAGAQFVDRLDDAEILFIAGSTIIGKELAVDAYSRNVPIVLRVDNIPRNSRNRNTGTSRLKGFADRAKLVIFQSEWAKNYIQPFIQAQNSTVILNGADTEFFNQAGDRQPKEGTPQYAFVQYNRDETKQWHQAWYEYQIIQRNNPEAHLWLIGRFSPENAQYNFDFYRNERFRQVGIIEDPRDMAEYLRSVDVLLMPYFNDACPNVMIEALLCGAKVIHNGTGGTAEIEQAYESGASLSAERMVDDYLREFSKLIL